MSKDRLYLFDTTLRDGAQTNGVDFALEDKVQVARILDLPGVITPEQGAAVLRGDAGAPGEGASR